MPPVWRNEQHVTRADSTLQPHHSHCTNCGHTTHTAATPLTTHHTAATPLTLQPHHSLCSTLRPHHSHYDHTTHTAQHHSHCATQQPHHSAPHSIVGPYHSNKQSPHGTPTTAKEGIRILPGHQKEGILATTAILPGHTLLERDRAAARTRGRELRAPAEPATLRTLEIYPHRQAQRC